MPFLFKLKSIKGFCKKQQHKNQDYLKQIREDFSELTTYITTLDPIKLLSQLTLTFLFTSENIPADENQTDKWMRYIEFLSGLLLSKKYPQNPRLLIDGRDIEKIERLLDEYYKSISLNIIIASSGNNIDNDFKMVLDSVKLHSLYIRGESYSHQLTKVAEDLYSEYDEWFEKNLGFTIKEAVKISRSIIKEYKQRINKAYSESVKMGIEYADNLIKEKKAEEKDRDFWKIQKRWYVFYGDSDNILLFTVEELSKFSGFSIEKCEKYLQRLSQTFGYRNPFFQDTYNDPQSAPWDYNTIYERPIILHNGRYFVPLISRLSEVLLKTFYYDLIGDKTFWEKEGHEKYGKWLERRTAECFQEIFPSEEIYLGPKYPNGNELTDVLILHDHKVFIVQCKAKRMKYESLIGKDYTLLKTDLEKGIKDAFEQGIRARDYMVNNEKSKIYTNGGDLIIDSKPISDAFIVSVTLFGYQNFTTRWSNTNSTLKLFENNQYPWAVSLFDLMTITELIKYPAMFTHYIKRRLQIEQTKFSLGADEIDLLGCYFTQGLYLEGDNFKKANAVYMGGYSRIIDKYMIEKYELGRNLEAPRQEMPENFEEYLKAIENLNYPYKTDCVMRLLELDYQGRKDFIKLSEIAKDKTKSDRQIHSFSMNIENNSMGFSFISMDAGGDIERLFEETRSFAKMKKYLTKFKEWVGFGWDVKSQNPLDVAVFLSFEHFKDPKLERAVNENLKKGYRIDLNNDKNMRTN